MTVRIKKPQFSNLRSRFDFGKCNDSDGAQTATIKELMDELVYERTTTTSGASLDTDAKQMSIHQLKPVLRLLRFISGKPLKSIAEKHPVADIKTIKTLYNYSYDSGMHLVSLLEPPGPKSQVIMDVLAFTPTQESERVSEAKRRIISDLEQEIPAKEKAQIDVLFSSRNAPHVYWKETNEAIDKVLLTHLHVDEDRGLLFEADDYLIAKTKEFMGAVAPIEREQRLHVAAYFHLRALEFLHSLHFEITTNRAIPNDKTISNIQVDFSYICKSIPPVHGVVIKGHTPFMSLDEVPAFCAENAAEIARLVSAATGFTYNKRDILTGRDAVRACYALAVYLASIKLPSNENPRPIGIVHVVAAFCSVLHQRKMKSKPKKSRRYGSKLAAPQKQLDAFIEGKEKHLAYTAWFIYSERTLWYSHAMLGRAHMTCSHRPLQPEQAKLIAGIYTSLDHVKTRELIADYREYIVKAARDFVVLHGREETRYEWIHGLR
ncbi:hypothetical protein NRY95_02580 [Xanthomonas campestris pv. phormiicola]|nr:hypothetical protein [Xanthomonas campestris pv. phormiicola]UYC16886.1 hypothetical protein NRY95_02580 [Xanthomonas campestris pv. phormiicola]